MTTEPDTVETPQPPHPTSPGKLLAFSSRYLLRWVLYALLIGTAVGTVSFAFEWTLYHLRVLISHTWLWGLPVAGGLMAAVLIRWEKRVACDGVQVYIDAVSLKGTWPGILLLPLKFLASVITLATGGSGGRVGPVVLMGGSFGSFASKLTGAHHPSDRATATMCGAAAAVGALMRAPLGGGIFAAEVLYPSSIRYRGLFPALLSSTAGYLVRKFFFPEVWPLELLEGYVFSPRELLPVFAVAILAGLAGLGFTLLYRAVEARARQMRQVAWLTPAAGALLVVVFGWITYALGAEGTEIMGTGEHVFKLAIDQKLSLMLLVVILVFKALATVTTVASGGSGGLFFPSVLLGALVGAALSNALGALQALHLGLVSAAMAASLAAVVNVPIAAAVMMIEIFGVGYGVPIILGAVVGFMIGRPGVIYHYGRLHIKTIEEED
ncbi:MAG TPA: chloride channel protein [Planctomycetota bacterium]|nr:chloride channel protein [Planctomycetota bacterium]